MKITKKRLRQIIREAARADHEDVELVLGMAEKLAERAAANFLQELGELLVTMGPVDDTVLVDDNARVRLESGWWGALDPLRGVMRRGVADAMATALDLEEGEEFDPYFDIE